MCVMLRSRWKPVKKQPVCSHRWIDLTSTIQKTFIARDPERKYFVFQYMRLHVKHSDPFQQYNKNERNWLLHSRLRISIFVRS